MITAEKPRPADPAVEHLDVIVVGAGLSGVGAGYRLQERCPGKSYLILEARQSLGGTWDLFRYPGIRSDSDMFTLGYPFRPWRRPEAIADGSSILEYIEQTAAEFGIERRIRYGQKVTGASWDSARARWTVEVNGGPDAGGRFYTCGFLYMCSGYYSYEAGYLPDFPGIERFGGRVVHPQKWPGDLDWAGRRVVVIGSGATAVTLLPSMADTAGHVVMLQRSPTYIASLPGVDPVASLLRRVLPGRLAHQAARLKSILLTQGFYQFCQRFPGPARSVLARMTAAQLPPGYALDPDFNPRYNPWDQRMCMVRDGDLFKAIREGRASVVTDRIATFTEHGIELESGRHLDADIVIAATGLQLLPAGGITVEVDGVAVRPADTFVYKGLMLSGLPNFAMCVGYTNASWTLRADLSSQYVCRLLRHMDRHGYGEARPVHQTGETGSTPFLDLKSGYVQRAAAILPKQGDRAPWRLRQNYVLDYVTARFSDITEAMSFRPAPSRSASPAGEATAAAV